MKTVSRLLALAAMCCSIAAAWPTGSGPATLPGASAVLVQDAHARGSSSSSRSSSSSSSSSSRSSSGSRHRSRFDDDDDAQVSLWLGLCLFATVGCLVWSVGRWAIRASTAS